MKNQTYFVEDDIPFYGIHLYDAEPYNLKIVKTEFKHLKKKEKIFIVYNPIARVVEFKSRAFCFKATNVCKDDYKVVV